MTRSIATMLVVAGSLLLTACPGVDTDTSCTAFKPILYSPTLDSQDTVTAVRQHNAAWVALCEKRRLGL